MIAGAYVRPLQAYFRAQEQVAARKDEVARLTAQQARLERRLAAAGTDAFVEQQARKLGLVRPGEHLFIVKGLPGDTETGP
jgi:cell division protein FtsB